MTYEQAPLEQDPEPWPRPTPENGVTGWAVLLLSERVPVGRTNDLFEHARNNDDTLGPLLRYLLDNRVARTERLVTSVSVEDLLRAEEDARGSDFPPLESLAWYWRIDAAQTGKGPEQVAREILDVERDRDPAVRGVVDAYAETTVEDPGGPIAGPLTAQTAQGWLRPAAEGVDALHAWSRPGGRGEQVHIVDVEQGWRFDHPDITGLTTTPLFGRNHFEDDPAAGDHGTSVLGIVAGRVNSVGGSGIASSPAGVVVSSHYDGGATVRIVDAIAAATKNLPAGGVLLLEVQRPSEGYLPVETDNATYTAIRAASAKGIVVVEAAGNGDRSLSEWTGSGGRKLSRDVPDFDSGAVVVAACQKIVEHDPAGPASGHRRHAAGFSNYGSRVDCYAWGEGVQAAVVAGYGSFGGTSAASAIIAGVAAATQGMQLAAGGKRLGPKAMRRLLASPGGTRQVPVASTFTIGVMPNLRTIAGMLPQP